MAKNDNLTDFLTDVANAIRTKKGTTALINPQDFSMEIASIQTGGGSDMLQERVDKTNSCAYLFYNYSGDTLDFINKLNTNNVNNINYMFYWCTNLTTLDLSWMNVSNVTSMQNVFNTCNKLNSINLNNWDTSKVNSMNNMFNSCSALTSLDLSSFNTSNVTTINSMFNGCSKITTLNLSNFDVSKVTDMGSLFSNCKLLTSLDLSNWNTSNVKWMNNMFQSNSNIETIDLTSFNTSKVQSMSNMFVNDTKLISILGIIDMYSCTSCNSMFGGCYKLTNLTLKNIKINLQINNSDLLTNASLLNTGQELWDNTNNALGGTRTLTMSTQSKTAIQSIYVKLVDITDEMRANDQYIDNKKPCVECDSTDESAMTLEEYIISKGWAIA